MKILEVKTLAIPEIKIIKYARFNDERGYFTETFKRSDFDTNPDLSFLKDLAFVQTNESHSVKNVIRGLHFQWNPYMGKLVRPIRGHLIDLALDIRKNSPFYGKIIAYDLLAKPEMNCNEWIWLPPGFAHGVFFLEETTIEYSCTGEYSPTCEVGISPLAPDIDWSLCDPNLKNIFDEVKKNAILSPKDAAGLTLAQWTTDDRSSNFKY